MVHDIALNKLKRIKTVFFSPDFSSKNVVICEVNSNCSRISVIKTSLEIFVTKSENQLSEIKTLPPTDSLR